MNDSDHAVASTMAREWTSSNTDPNEIAATMSHLREAPDGEHFLQYLDTVIHEGQAVVRSGRTLEYYRSIRDICREYLAPYRNDPKRMAEIIGWAVRLMRYYQVEDRLEQPPPRVTAKPKVVEKAEAGRHTGRVKWFNAGKGYGFLTPDEGGDDLFFHVSQLAGGLKAPDDGTRVSFVLGKGPKGRTQAQDVRPVYGEAVP